MKQSVIAIVYNSNRKVLLIKRRDVPVWVFPGGGLESDETPEAGVLRETLEETGLNVKIQRKVGEYYPINALSNYTHLFECIAEEGVPQTGDETREIDFFDMDKLPKNFFIVHYDWLNDALRSDAELIKKPIDNVTYGKLVRYFLRHPIHVLRFALSRLGFPINS